MRTSAPPLLPILRSQLVAELLAAFLLHPEHEYTLGELAQLTNNSISTVTRDVNRLAESGLVTERQVGRSRILTTSQDHPYIRPLTEMISHSFGPATVIAEEFAGFGLGASVAVFGSWAARYTGTSGPTPQDVDVLIVGTATRSEIYDAAERAEARLYRMPVNPVHCSRERWFAATDALIQSVHARPLVWVVGSEPQEADKP
ncbi:MAG TPA: helix-turn-helix domain-containing protein [Actinocrinis sp.]|nr:helix-turn-helix domain-containing protein [Actinocrinis sp.]